MDNIAIDLNETAREGVYWIHLAQDTDMQAMRRAPVNTVLNLRIHRMPVD
jgi:hypothetical protein